MLTVNCDTHPFYKRFHKPGDEKRKPIFLRPDEYGPWLQAKVDDAPAFFKQYAGPLLGEPAPLVRLPKLVGEPAAKDEVVPAKVAKAPSKSAAPKSPPAPDQGEHFLSRLAAAIAVQTCQATALVRQARAAMTASRP